MAHFTTVVLLLTLSTFISSSLILPPSLLEIAQNLPVSNQSNVTTKYSFPVPSPRSPLNETLNPPNSLHTPTKPYWVVFPVPGTDLVLEVHLSPLPPSHSLRPNSIPILLDVAHDVVDQLISRSGPDTPLPRNLHRERNPQEFEWDTGTGARLLVLGKSQWHLITLGMVRDVVGGLRLYLRDGREMCRVKLRFRVGGDRNWRGWGEIWEVREGVRRER